MKKLFFIVLILILIIAGWIYIHTYETPVQEVKGYENNFDSLAIKARNETLNDFLGENKTYTDIRALLNKINSLNSEDKKENNRYGHIEIGGMEKMDYIKADYFYTIQVSEYYENGSIKTIDIIKQ